MNPQTTAAKVVAVTCAHHEAGETGYVSFKADVPWRSSLVLHSAYAEMAADRDNWKGAAMSGQARYQVAESQLAELRGRLNGLARLLERDSAQPYAPIANELQAIAAADGEASDAPV